MLSYVASRRLRSVSDDTPTLFFSVLTFVCRHISYGMYRLSHEDEEHAMGSSHDHLNCLEVCN